MARDTILVTGSRSWTDRPTIREWLETAPKGVINVVHGAARGADRIADEVGLDLGFCTVPFPVDTSIDGPWPAAGVVRNKRMVTRYAPRVWRVFAFVVLDRGEMTRGTAHCVQTAIAHNLPVTIIQPGLKP
jgi:hypothetical protein